MKNTLFAEVNGSPIRGSDVLCSVRRILSEQDEESYASSPNPENSAYINAEGLQQYIERLALRDAAKAEGFIIDEDSISAAIYDLRSSCEDEGEFQTLIHGLGLEISSLRREIEIDLYVEALFNSRLGGVNEPGEEEAREFYSFNKEAMKVPETYTFIEIEAEDNAREAAAVLGMEDGAKIMTEAKKRGIKCSFSEEMKSQELPEALQNVLSDLEVGKIASLPTDEGTVMLIKLLKKTESRLMSEEETLEGLKEYLTVMQHKALADILVEEALEKAEVIYHNADLLKKLS